MTLSPLRRLALAGMVAFLVGGAPLAQITEAAQDDSIEAVRTRANAGDADAQSYLAGLYHFGGVEGVPQDDVEAAAWQRKAAEQGHARAQDSLGAMYRTGEGVPQDDTEAVAWFRRAAEQGYAAAQDSLGRAYDFDLGVPEDDVEAYKWYNLATTYADASQREIFAEMRDFLAERLIPEQRAEGQRRAREFFEAHPPE